MGRLGGGLRGRSKIAAAVAVALALAACASVPSRIYDLTAANPPPTRALRAQIRIGQPSATADLDGDRILVRDTPITLATLFVNWLLEAKLSFCPNAETFGPSTACICAPVVTKFPPCGPEI